MYKTSTQSIKSPRSSIRGQTSPRNSSTRTISKYSDGYIYRPSKDNFNILKDTFTREFATCCYMDFIHPELNFKFNSVDKSFDLFMQYAISESNWNHGNMQPASPEKFQKSVLTKLGQQFSVDWIDFMSMMSTTINEGITPHHQFMIDKSTKLYDYLENLSTIFQNGNYKSDVCISAIKNLKSEIRSIQKVSRKVVFSEPTEITPMQSANEEKLLNRIRQLNEKISNLYTKTMSKSTLTTGELYRAKTAMNQLCGDMLQIVSGAIRFNQVSEKLKMLIVELNSCLAELFKTIGIPVDLTQALSGTVIIEEEEQGEENAEN